MIRLIILSACLCIAVMFGMCSIAPHMAEANLLFSLSFLLTVYQ